jgi:uncharacterized protein YbjT (DUF2867 family)
MPEQKTIVVLGATGAQGGGLVRAILKDAPGQYRARAVARDPNSAKARQLADLGAEVVRGDVDDEDSLKRAFENAWGAYCVTFYWAHFSPEKEMAQAAAMARAAKAAGLGHVIWSTLEDTRKWVPLGDNRMPTLNGKYKVPHFDAKGASDHYFLESGVPATLLLTSFYWDNFIEFGMGPRRGPDGTLAIGFPMDDRKLPGIAAEDIGGCAFGIFQRAGQYAGKTVGIAGEFLTGAEMAAAFTRALGQEVRYHDIPPDAFRALGFPGADDLGNMFQFKRDFNDYFCGARDLALSRVLNPGLQTFDVWLARNQSRIPLD